MLDKYLCEQYAGTHRALDTVLERATDHQKKELLVWIETTALDIMGEQASTRAQGKGLLPGTWLEFLELITKKWNELGPKRSVQSESPTTQDSFSGLLDNPKAVWQELGDMEGGDSHA